MPRAVRKSKADKGGRKSSIHVTTSPMQDLGDEDIIPGLFTQAQWMDMLIQEEADETVGEIMEELMSKVMEGCLKVHVEGQVKSVKNVLLTDTYRETLKIKKYLACTDSATNNTCEYDNKWCCLSLCSSYYLSQHPGPKAT